MRSEVPEFREEAGTGHLQLVCGQRVAMEWTEDGHKADSETTTGSETGDTAPLEPQEIVVYSA